MSYLSIGATTQVKINKADVENRKVITAAKNAIAVEQSTLQTQLAKLPMTKILIGVGAALVVGGGLWMYLKKRKRS